VLLHTSRLTAAIALTAGLSIASPALSPSAADTSAPPEIASPTEGQVLTNPSFNVLFSNPGGASSFQILLDEGSTTQQTFPAWGSGAPIYVPSSGQHTLRVQSLNGDGSAGSSSALRHFEMLVPPPGPPGISINNGAQYTNNRDVTIRLAWPTAGVNYDSVLIDNDGGFATAQKRTLALTTPWTLPGLGNEKLPKTVYVRWTRSDSGGTTYSAETFTDDIVLDLTLPTIESATSATPATGHGSGRRRQKVKVRADDTVSGVAQIQFARSKAKPGPLTPYDKTAYAFNTAPKFVRVLDQAGNFSAWKKIRVKRTR
jgi:hypothetical protein